MTAGRVRDRQRLRPNCETSVCSRAVTPVIGIVLLVSIVTVIAATAGAFFFAFSDVNDPAPQAAFDVDVNEQEGQAVITVDGGETIDADALSVAGGEIAHAPETLYAGSTLQIDLIEDADQLQLLYEQDDSSTILTETDRDPFINVTVRYNPGIPGVLVTSEDDGTVIAEDRTDSEGIARLAVGDSDNEYDIVIHPEDDEKNKIEDSAQPGSQEINLSDELDGLDASTIASYSTLDEDDINEILEEFPNNPWLENAQTDKGGIFANLGGGEVVALEEGTKMSDFPTGDGEVFDLDGEFMQPVYASTVDESISVEVDSIDFGPTSQALGVDPYNEREFGEDNQWYRIPTGIGTPYPISGSETAWDEDGNWEGEPIAGDPDGDYKLVEVSETDDGFKVVWEYLG